tara:strand:- start:35425 stop:38262 length:2838 start_codon:yes stop_codon:yes gene_type:complete
MQLKKIIIRGAREHNLKNIDIAIPKNKLVVITGVSGSGKSTLAFDTIYAEGQRRYVESLSSYARQFLGKLDKPDVDNISGLSPTISIDQKTTSHNPRSTVGTVTEIYDYLRLLFSRIGDIHCYKCGNLVEQQSIEQIADAINSIPNNSRIQILSPVIIRKKGEHKNIFDYASKSGFVRVRVNGETLDLSNPINLEKNKYHDVEIVVDRLIISKDIDMGRLTESIETAAQISGGLVLVSISGMKDILFSENFACIKCNISIGKVEPRNFSFNSPHGACSLCDGLGYKLVVDPDLIVPNPDLSIKQGAIEPWNTGRFTNKWFVNVINSLSNYYDIDKDVPFQSMSKDVIKMLFYGEFIIPSFKTKRKKRGFGRYFEGFINNLERRYKETTSSNVRLWIENYMTSLPCHGCKSYRLRPESLSVKICGLNIMDISSKTVKELNKWFKSIKSKNSSVHLNIQQLAIADKILEEIQLRIQFLLNIGLHYITLSRPASSLSGGEAQRIRLATQIGSGLTGVIYVCDEPSIGLHPADGNLLINTLNRLKVLGNTVIIVEHDEAIIRSADWIIDLGPGAGKDGGTIIFSGSLKSLLSSKKSLTGQYLSGALEIATPLTRRKGNGKKIVINEAYENNLKNITIEIPLGLLVCVTGVSGSGKSTLVNEILYKTLSQKFNRSKIRPGKNKGVDFQNHIDKIVNVTQSPIGRTPRSNPATYTGTFTYIRELFASMPEAKIRGYKPGRFSFNVKGGRCETCSGDGYKKIEMQFLPDVTVPCEVCNGIRYNREALEVTFKNKNISEILNMTVTEAHSFFYKIPKIRSKLETMIDVGLGYIQLGQPATQLSGGEAQRIKLSTELSKKSTGKTLYILDEPTTGLSFQDCSQLINVLQRLVSYGNTVIVIEHHLDLIKNADWIIDLGPGAGEDGGELVAEGTPESISLVKKSFTGKYLKNMLK